LNTILYSSPYVPPEWIAAHGLEPERLVPGRDGGTQGPVKPLEGICPFMRLFVNEAATKRDVAGVVLATVCDQMRHAKDLLDREATTPSFLLNVPSVWQTPSAHALYLAELARLGRFLETAGGQAPSHACLVETLDRYDRLRALRVPTDGLPPATHATHRQRRVPIALLGGPLTRDDRELHRLVAEYGGQVVLDGTDEGERAQPARFDRRRLQDDPLGELVSAYFGSIPDVFRRPNSELFTWLKRKVTERGVQGVILARQVWCDQWHAEVQRLRESLDIPLLDLDLDGEPCGARAHTRIQAFMESLG
jgi:benzoyl-CoA reductase/2-hydroxyglutaryl-CoA dehydratase subunit BcrC/BadD/HgdB